MSGEELRGVRIALDWGLARIGVAACDAEGLLAYPVETVPARDVPAARRRLAAIIAEYEPVVVYLGLPRHLTGSEGEAAQMARTHGVRLARDHPGVEVRLVDERLTTVSASRQLSEVGRSAKSQRAVIDQAAAVAILTHALDTERRHGVRAGERIDRRVGHP